MAATRGKRPDAILIAGPTASGKSALAIELASRFDGVVVNADSMQVYDALSILTARPGAGEMGGIEHRLYGHVPAGRAYSVAAWLEDAGAAMREIGASGRVPILAGGTGLYFKALEEGLSAIPDVDPAVRAKWREVARNRPESLHPALAGRDPAAAAVLEPGDTQRLTRALEVIEATGRSITEWQRDGRAGSALSGMATQKWLVLPERAELHERIGRRVERMVEAGALDEVRHLLSLGLAGELPAMRAIGVPQFATHLAGETDLATAIEQVKAATRQYAKRQTTWLRHQMDADWQIRPA